MDRQSVRIGEIVLDKEPRIALYAESRIPLSNAGIAVLKNKMAFLLDSHFRASDRDHRYVSMAAVEERWNCSATTIARLVRRGRLHPMVLNDEAFFDRDEVARVLARH
jgi:hypothetical protein